MSENWLIPATHPPVEYDAAVKRSEALTQATYVGGPRTHDAH